MATHYAGEVYTDVSQITGGSGFYTLRLHSGTVVVYVDQEYDGGGWVMVMANRKGTGGMKLLRYNKAVNSCNYRVGATNATNAAAPPRNVGLSEVNCFVGLKHWKYLGGRNTAGRITVVQFVAAADGVPLGNEGEHTKRYRWNFTGFSSTYAHQNVTSVSDETGTGTPGYYSMASAGRNLTTYDNDQDLNSGNCSTYYNNNPWWYDSCWTGNYFAGGSYQDGPYWYSSSTDYHQYGAVYIK